MSDYEFKIDAYTPQTIPMARLAEYMTALADLIGERDRVHFAALREGCTVVAMQVQREARRTVDKRLAGARNVDLSDDVGLYRSVSRLNDLLRADDADGELRTPDNVVVKFPGRREMLPEVIGPFNKSTDIDGVLVRVGGRDKAVHALLEDADGRTHKCEMNRELATRLATYLFGEPVRVSGTGRWVRNEQAQWELLRMHAERFKPLGNQSLVDTIRALRAVPLALQAPEYA